MWTECPNCRTKFQVDDNMFGKSVSCRKCRTDFNATWTLEPPPRIDIIESEKNDQSTTQVQKQGQDKLRQEITEKIAKITESINSILPVILSSSKDNPNESRTRLILDKIIQEILGYSLEDIRTERDIKGHKADYVLSVDGKEIMVIEAKRMALELREKQIFQATSYGAHSGIRWALLTNVQVWQLYHISHYDGKITPEQILSIDLRDGLDKQEAQFFYMFSKHGMKRQKFLETLRDKVMLLRYEKIMEAILSEGVVKEVTAILSRNYSGRLTQQEVKSAMENTLLR